MRIKQTTLLFLLAIVALAGGFYFIFDSFLLTTGEEIAKAWYYGEIVNLQEGQILPAIAKNQNFFEKSPFIKSVVLIDIKDPERNLFSVGEYPKAVTKNLLNEATKNKDMLTSFRSGFLAHRVLARLPANNGLFIIYEISSNFLIWSYFFTLAISLLFVIYLISITTKVTNSERKKQEQLRTDLLGRLAHDINSPLLAISGLSLKVKKIDNELHLRIEQATESIRRLFAQTGKLDRKLLENSISASVTDEDIELIPLAPALLEFLIQKRSEYLSEAGLKFDFSIPDNTHDKFVKINLDEFKRHLSNILKNAIEATRSELKKEISIVVLNSVRLNNSWVIC